MVPILFVWLSVFASPDRHAPSPFASAVFAADITPEARLKALSPFVGVGKLSTDVERVFGDSAVCIGHGPGFWNYMYFLPAGGSVLIGCYPDGEVHSINLKDKHGKSASVRSEGPITWPKTERK